MPVDPTSLRSVQDHNDRVTDGVKVLSKKLGGTDARSYDQIVSSAKAWTQNVHELKKSIESQQQVGSAMRESARIEYEQHRESFREKYHFIIERLQHDVKFYFHSLQEFVEPPQDFAKPKTWEHYTYEMELEMRRIEKAVQEQHAVSSSALLDPLVSLLNYRDALVSILLNGLLFQKAVLDWDLKTQRQYADGPMVQMFERVVNIYSKTEMVPDKLYSDVPSMFALGPFSYDKAKAEQKGQGGAAELSPLQSRLLTMLREMQLLHRGIRNLKFGEEVNIPEKDRPGGKTVPTHELRAEVTRWFNQAMRLEHELQQIKASKHTPGDMMVQQLNMKLEERENQSKQLVSRMHKLEHEIQALKNELAVSRREKAELAERSAKMAKENLPVLERLEKMWAKSRDAVDVLTADAELLSSMFREQVQENKNNIESREGIASELLKVQKQLKSERLKNQFKEDELQKKETLYLRTMAAHKHIHESYMDQKAQITAIEDQMRQKEAEWHEMADVVAGRDRQIAEYQEDLRRAHQRIDELEQHKKMCAEEFRRVTGKTFNMLLEQFNANQMMMRD
mmetsp:Transcript_31896/g.74618  ORF Transcript_31896/g.74618 Transcript_31896/m.74618 type:complete len:566 (-) Transcript_31896:94-1791(-)